MIWHIHALSLQTKPKDMIPFLRQVAQKYCSEGKMEGSCFIFPNRRSIVFFQKYVAEAVSGSASGIPVMMPQMFTENDFFYKLNNVPVTDRITLLLKLYECYKDMGNCEDAVRWLMLSVESGYDWAQITLGDCYMEGECIRYDASEAAKWYRIAAEKGNECAQYDLGRCYEKGLGVSVDAEQAVYWYGKAAEQGYTLAFSAMKDCYDSNGMAKDKVIALEKLAAAGNNSAKYSLAKCYVDADGVSRDLSKAVELFMELCDTGDDIDMASSAYMLYRICKMGETLPQGDAMYWLKKACSIQTKYIYPKAAYDLAKAYDTGDGVAQSNEQAMFWYKVGAENGDKDSQFEYAKKVTGDEKKHWLRCAAEAGHTMAQRFLAIIYYDEGYYSYAGHWFARAAQGGDVVAKTYLREYYGMYIE